MAADGAGGAVGVKTEEKGTLSSFAIVGIVGGILVFFIGAYIGWYQWVSGSALISPGNARVRSPFIYSGPHLFGSDKGTSTRADCSARSGVRSH